MTAAKIQFYYSTHSIFAYLGMQELRSVSERTGRRIEHRPINLDKVIEGQGITPFEARSPKRANYFFVREVERWAQVRNVSIPDRYPRAHFKPPDLANRVLIAALHEELPVDDLAHRFMSAHWTEGADLSDADTVSDIASRQGLDAPRLLASAEGEQTGAQYAANTDEAISRGVMGSPTFFVDGDMFYGQDRLDHVERAADTPFKHIIRPFRTSKTRS